MASVDIKDAYFQIPVHPLSRKFLRFVWQSRTYRRAVNAGHNVLLDTAREGLKTTDETTTIRQEQAMVRQATEIDTIQGRPSFSHSYPVVATAGQTHGRSQPGPSSPLLPPLGGRVRRGLGRPLRHLESKRVLDPEEQNLHVNMQELRTMLNCLTRLPDLQRGKVIDLQGDAKKTE